MSGPFSHWVQGTKPPSPDQHPPGSDTLLPPSFQFSQQSLQDYVNCHRRFQLAYVENLSWPAAESEPVEEQEHIMQQGAHFHLMVQRHLMGVPLERLTPSTTPLTRWWQNYLDHAQQIIPPGQQLVEIALSVPVGARRLTARFDLLVVEPGKHITIIDWKTSRSRPKRSILAARMQTKVYPYIVTRAAAHLFGSPIRPDQVSMVYWFAEAPTVPERFAYDASQHATNSEEIEALIQEITQGYNRDEIWPLTEEEWHCKYCIYRSLCERGVQAGQLSEAEGEDPTLEAGEASISFALEDVDEIAF
jgi:CRISPR/Cas system-associated exonuclease Cas4 (RecB family)